MNWPVPQPGLVVRYSYLWWSEAEAGREEGVKDRPCAIVIAIEAQVDRPRVIVVPITHSPPQPPDEGIELPQPTKLRLGLDSQRSWVIVSEGNIFTWPGPDLRFPPGHGPESAAHGVLPPRLFRLIRDRFVFGYMARSTKTIPRSE